MWTEIITAQTSQDVFTDRVDTSASLGHTTRRIQYSPVVYRIREQITPHNQYSPTVHRNFEHLSVVK